VVKSTTEAQPGDIVSVSVRKNAPEPAMRVPTGALMPVLKGNRVFIVNDGKAEPRDVVTGTRNDSSVLILSGLQAGDSLITGGLMFVKPGIPVKVTPNKTSRP
jgi:membrane fusion protein (multidrug efflux system)